MRKRPLALGAYYFASFAAFGVYLPFFPRWLEARGIDGVAMGAVAATLPAMGVVGPPAFGLVADALGLRRGLLRVACGGAFVAFGGVTLAAALPASPGFGPVFLAMLLFALFKSPMVMMADVVALEHTKATGDSYGRIRLWGSVGFLLAALGVGRLVDPAEMLPLPLAVVGGLAAAFLATLALPGRELGQAAAILVPPRGHARELVASADVRLFLGATFLAQVAHSAYDLCFSLHLRDLGLPGPLVGLAWALGVVAEVGLMAFSGSLLGRVRPATLLPVALAGASVRWALLATVRSTPILLALQPLHALSFALMWVASQSYLQRRVGPGSLGTAQGLFSASSAAGSVAGLLVWGATYEAAGGGRVFGAAALVAAGASVVAALFARRAPHGAAVGSAA